MGNTESVRLLLEAAPATALTADVRDYLPLHVAAQFSRTESVRLLLEVAPEALLRANAEGQLPLHVAAGRWCREVVRLLVEAAPVAALVTDAEGSLPLDIALEQAVEFQYPALYLTFARLLLPASPPERALAALVRAGEVALPLFADLAACTALTPGQWQHIPSPCPALGGALPAVLARSVAEAALLVGRLPAEVRQRLRTVGLCLVRAQRVHKIELPPALVGQVLALAAAAEGS